MILMKGNCLELMKNIPDKSVDLILCDLPYGAQIGSKWDKQIPFEPLWAEYKRIIKDRCAIVLFGKEPFSSKLRLSNLDWFKYDFVWCKNCPTGFVNAKNKPMNKHETISVFSNGKTANLNKFNMFYYPQGLKPCNKTRRNRNKLGKDATYARPSTVGKSWYQEYTNYPDTVLNFKKPAKPVHPTQKPTKLLEYLVKTYTLEGETVLDNCMGSGSTGVACINTNRNFIGIEKDTHYFEVAKGRIEQTVKDKKQEFNFEKVRA
jgi:site-specific DNA-methyltransferase (adenine-specific)